MIRRSFRIGLTLGLLGGVVFALAKVFGAKPAEPVDAAPAATPEPWPPLRAADVPVVAPAVVEPEPFPTPPAEAAPPKAPANKAPAKKKAPAKAWVEPSGGVCPTSHPVKAKLASKIFHLPGMLNYERTNPDRCYANAAKAEADGLRAAKR